jgi:hypothetical protein
MKTDLNGVSQCPKEQENYESFTYKGKEFIQYEYKLESGELFTTVQKTLELCREKRDKYFDKQNPL